MTIFKVMLSSFELFKNQSRKKINTRNESNDDANDEKESTKAAREQALAPTKLHEVFAAGFPARSNTFLTEARIMTPANAAA